LQFDAQFFSARGADGEVILSPAAFHGQNLFWHEASVLLVFALWHRLTGACWRSFFVAALFAVHPMHVESVAWATERKDVLSCFFGALTLWAYVHYQERPGWKRYLGMSAAFLVSLLAKPMLITLPFVLLLLDYWPLGRFGTAASLPSTARGPILPRARLGWLVREKVPLLILAGMIAAVTLEKRESHGALVSFHVISLSARLANALTAYGSYLGSTFWPTELAVLYPHRYENWSGPQALAGAGCLLSITALSLWQANRRPWLMMGWLWFVGTLFPVIGLAQGGAQAWADRFSYWPHIGLFVAVVWEVGEWAQRCRVPSLVPRTVGALVLGSLAALTWAQLGHWRDSVTLWEHALAVTKENDRAHQRLASRYRKRGRLQEAEAHLHQAHRIQFQRRHGPGAMPTKPANAVDPAPEPISPIAAGELLLR
jgi:tetratricopeptide (TPR) repeat protein